MSVIYPEGTQAQGNVSWQVVMAVANEQAAKLNEVLANANLDISCFLYEGSLDLTVNQNKVEAQRRNCTRDTFQRFGNRTYEIGDAMYVYDPQADDDAEENKAKELLTDGLKAYLFRRLGKDAQNDPWEVGDRYKCVAVEFGEQVERGDTSNESNEIQIQQPLVIRKRPVSGIVVANS